MQINRNIENRTTVSNLVKELFINDWNVTKSYEKYIKECAPRVCTYSYTYRNNLIQIVTILFGLIGGLTMGLKFLVGQILLRLIIFIKNRKLRRQRVTPCNTKPNVQQGKNLPRKRNPDNSLIFFKKYDNILCLL